MLPYASLETTVNRATFPAVNRDTLINASEYAGVDGWTTTEMLAAVDAAVESEFVSK